MKTTQPTQETLNRISQDAYGRNYDALPDDGAEQDHVQHVASLEKSSKDDIMRAAAPAMLEALKAICAILKQPCQTSDLKTDDSEKRLLALVKILRGDCVIALRTATNAIRQARGEA